MPRYPRNVYQKNNYLVLIKRKNGDKASFWSNNLEQAIKERHTAGSTVQVMDSIKDRVYYFNW